MVIIDRVFQKVASFKGEIQGPLELGRYCFLDGPYKGMDVTRRTFPDMPFALADNILNEETLETDNLRRFCQELPSDIIPFLQNSQPFKLGTHESLLLQKLGDLKHMCEIPAYKIDRDVIKQYTSTVKRISARSYEYAASHSEDWEYNSVLSFRPKKIIAEVLDDNYDIYENRLLVKFIKLVVDRLYVRISKYRDFATWIEKYMDLSSELEISQSNWMKYNRNIALFQRVYSLFERENLENQDQKDVDDIDTVKSGVKEKIEELERARTSLLGFSNSIMLKKLFRYSLANINYHDTNLLRNDRYYRSLRLLWGEWSNRDSAFLKENISNEQNVIRGIRRYVLSLILYTIEKCFKWTRVKEKNIQEEAENVYKYVVSNSSKQESSMTHLIVELGEYDSIVVKILLNGQTEMTNRLVVLCSEPQFDLSELQDDEYIIYYGEHTGLSKGIGVNLNDKDSVERIGRLLRSILLSNLYRNRIRKSFTLKNYQSLINFKDIFLTKEIDIVSPKGEYYYSYIPHDIKFDEKSYESNLSILGLSKNQKRKAKTELESLIKHLNNASRDFRQSLQCPCCGSLLTADKLDVLTCTNTKCNHKISILNSEMVLSTNDCQEVNSADLDNYFGMDYVGIRI